MPRFIHLVWIFLLLGCSNSDDSKVLPEDSETISTQETDTDADVDSDSDTDVDMDTDSDTDTDTDTDTDSDTDSDSDTDTDTDSDSDTIKSIDMGTDSGNDTNLGQETESDTRISTETETASDLAECMAPPAEESGYLFFSGYEVDPFDSEWGLSWNQGTNHDIVDEPVLFGEHAARVTYPEGTYSSEGGAQYKMDFAKLPTPIPYSDEMYVRYYLRFEEGIDFIKGGKLPGLIGGAANTGGTPSTGFDGWSARIMWRDNGRIVQYVYHPDQAGEYGDDFDWDYGGASRFFIPGKWHCVETYIRMNTVNGEGEENALSDGVIRSWLDGELALERTDIRFRFTNDFNIDGFYFSTFFGGGDESWAPVKDEHAWFDNAIISDTRIGCLDACIIPPYTLPGPTTIEEQSAVLVFDGDGSGWNTASWNRDDSTIVFESTEANHTDGGTASAAIKFSSTSWDAAVFQSPTPFNPGDFTHVRFWIQAREVNPFFRVQFRGNENSDDVTVDGSFTYHNGPFEIGQWQQVIIPIADFNSVDNQTELYIRSATNSETAGFFLDDVALVVGQKK